MFLLICIAVGAGKSTLFYQICKQHAVDEESFREEKQQFNTILHYDVLEGCVSGKCFVFTAEFYQFNLCVFLQYGE